MIWSWIKEILGIIFSTGHTVGAARIVTFLDINLQFLAYNSTYYVISALELTIILDTIHIILHSLSV